MDRNAVQPLRREPPLQRPELAATADAKLVLRDGRVVDNTLVSRNTRDGTGGEPVALGAASAREARR